MNDHRPTLRTASLQEAFSVAGIPFPQRRSETGGFERFPTGENRRDTNGFLRVFPDGMGAVFGCWGASKEFTWQRDTGKEITQQQRDNWQRQVIAARAESDRIRHASYVEAAAQAAAKRASYQPAPRDHPYLAKKGIAPNSARIDPDGRLVVAIYGEDGAIQSLQSIAADGAKRFMTGGKVQGGFCLFGSVRADGPILLAEGWATAATLHEATGLPVYAAFSASNLHHVAKMLEARYPTAQRVICGDDDFSREDNVGRKAAQAAAAATGALAVFPDVQPGGSDFNDLARESGLERVRDLVMLALENTEEPRFKFQSLGELAEGPPGMELIRGVLPTEGIAGVYGASASGKSFFVYDAAAAIANGDPEWFGHVITKSVPVTIVSLEGAMNNRAAALQLKRGDCPNLKIVRTSLDIRLEADRAALVKDIRRIGFAGGVLVIDTLSRSAGGIDENGPREMGEYIAHIESMRVALGGLVVLIHHSGKDAAKGMRGHTSLFAALDTVIEVTATDGRREWKLIKSKEGEAGIVHPFNLEIHHLGDNPDGTPITSCTVQEDHSEAVDQTFTQKKKPLGANQKTLWRELGVLLRASVHFGMAGAPPTRPCLRLSEVVDAVQGTLVVTDEKRRIERTKAALDGLLDKDLIRHRDGWIWEV